MPPALGDTNSEQDLFPVLRRCPGEEWGTGSEHPLVSATVHTSCWEAGALACELQGLRRRRLGGAACVGHPLSRKRHALPCAAPRVRALRRGPWSPGVSVLSFLQGASVSGTPVLGDVPAVWGQVVVSVAAL